MNLPPDTIHPLTLEEWRAWLAENHETSTGVGVVLAKPTSGLPSVGYVEAVEEGLCWGWIDSVTRPFDEHHRVQRFSPRKKGSGWAKTNKERLLRLQAEGRLQPAGRAVIERAKADGSWTLLDGPEAGIVPDDLAQALEAPGARAGFDALPTSERKRILGWLAQAKTEATRTRRLTQTALNCAAGRRFDQWTKETT